ncbi:MAG TPA: hypothetical protein VNW15_16270 [Rhizomicrobium sp.]|nr:hypothetical protein [Rhizomicrobium sp.]
MPALAQKRSLSQRPLCANSGHSSNHAVQQANQSFGNWNSLFDPDVTGLEGIEPCCADFEPVSGRFFVGGTGYWPPGFGYYNVGMGWENVHFAPTADIPNGGWLPSYLSPMQFLAIRMYSRVAEFPVESRKAGT